MITDDPATSPYSPNYKGSNCIHCGRIEDVNEKGECEKCETGVCFLCEKMVGTNKLRAVKNKQVCTECIDYEGIQVVRELILRINLKEERHLRIQSENKLKEFYKPVLTT
jgi:hypothetical protein